ncbi:MAG: permease [Romboutsia sp.]
MTSYILYAISLSLLIVSFFKDKNKTKKALTIAVKSFENIMPQFISIVVIIGIVLSLLDTNTVSLLIGENSGFFGIIISAIVGSITLMPTFVAFSTADTLLKSGAGYPQVAALVSTLTMVGVLTFTLECKYIGKKAALYRNLIAFLFSFLVALIMGMVFS